MAKREAPEGYITHIAEHFQLNTVQWSVRWMRIFAMWGMNVCCLEAYRTVLPHQLLLAQSTSTLRGSEKLYINNVL